MSSSAARATGFLAAPGDEPGRDERWSEPMETVVIKTIFLALVSLLAVLLVFLQPPIAQDPLYHQFVDQRGLLGIPNWLNVLSNLPYIAIGFIGFRRLSKKSAEVILQNLCWMYQLFFLAVLLVGAGSCYYHLWPDNTGLMLDRLAIALGFMTFLALVIAELIDEKAAVVLFPWLVFTGLSSVLYWHWSESLGQGDLRLYILVQFLPLVIIPMILLMFHSRFTMSHTYWLILACYIVAKGFELTDGEIFAWGEVVSGHTLKHLVSALAPWLFYRSLRHRSRVKPPLVSAGIGTA
jgi:hypothetical protein